MLVPFFLNVNDLEICFHGMSRSGNHAVIDWIKSMYSEPVDFWNNANNPPRKFIFHKKSVLIHSHENFSITKFANDKLEKFHDLYLGKSQKRINIILLRDPFNLFASHLQGLINQNKNQALGVTNEEYASIWKEHAREYLGITSYLSENKITISYNQWCLDKSYRQKIANYLEVKYQETTLENVITSEKGGAGSSFDKYRYSNQASHMTTLERWKNMLDNHIYKLLLKDDEIWTLSQQVFGDIPGTNTALINLMKSP